MQAEEARYGVSKRHKERLELLLPSKPLSVFGHGPPRCPTAAVAGTRNAGRKLKVKKKSRKGRPGRSCSWKLIAGHKKSRRRWAQGNGAEPSLQMFATGPKRAGGNDTMPRRDEGALGGREERWAQTRHKGNEGGGDEMGVSWWPTGVDVGQEGTSRVRFGDEVWWRLCRNEGVGWARRYAHCAADHVGACRRG